MKERTYEALGLDDLSGPRARDLNGTAAGLEGERFDNATKVTAMAHDELINGNSSAWDFACFTNPWRAFMDACCMHKPTSEVSRAIEWQLWDKCELMGAVQNLHTSARYWLQMEAAARLMPFCSAEWRADIEEQRRRFLDDFKAVKQYSDIKTALRIKNAARSEVSKMIKERSGWAWALTVQDVQDYTGQTLTGITKMADGRSLPAYAPEAPR